MAAHGWGGASSPGIAHNAVQSAGTKSSRTSAPGQEPATIADLNLIATRGCAVLMPSISCMGLASLYISCVCRAAPCISAVLEHVLCRYFDGTSESHGEQGQISWLQPSWAQPACVLHFCQRGTWLQMMSRGPVIASTIADNSCSQTSILCLVCCECMSKATAGAGCHVTIASLSPIGKCQCPGNGIGGICHMTLPGGQANEKGTTNQM